MEELYSYSKISSFHNCSWSWYLRYVKGIEGKDNVYGLLGNVIHDCYEEITKGELTIDDAIQTFSDWALRIGIAAAGVSLIIGFVLYSVVDVDQKQRVKQRIIQTMFGIVGIILAISIVNLIIDLF